VDNEAVSAHEDVLFATARWVLLSEDVTHRIDVRRSEDDVLIEVEGLVDATALTEIRLLIATSGAGTPRVLLRGGTNIDRRALAALRRLGVAVAAESPYLAWWLVGSEPEPRSDR
jgi:hypothetical protein